jgi:hypothetical protein
MLHLLECSNLTSRRWAVCLCLVLTLWQSSQRLVTALPFENPSTHVPNRASSKDDHYILFSQKSSSDSLSRSVSTGALSSQGKSPQDDRMTNSDNIHKVSDNYKDKRIVAIGDLHSDLDAAIHLLDKIGIIHKDNHKVWVAENTILVLTGDAVDRGDDSKDLYVLLYSLQQQATSHNSELIILNGIANCCHIIHITPKK